MSTSLHIVADCQHVVGWWLALKYVQTPPTDYFLESSGQVGPGYNTSFGHFMLVIHSLSQCFLPPVKKSDTSVQKHLCFLCFFVKNMITNSKYLIKNVGRVVNSDIHIKYFEATFCLRQIKPSSSLLRYANTT